jgi:hypothetical protein
MPSDLNPRPYFQILHSVLREDASPAEMERSHLVYIWLTQNGNHLHDVCTADEWDLLGAIVDYFLANQLVVPTFDLLEQYLRTKPRTKSLLDLLEEYNEHHADALKRLEYPDLHFSLNQRTEDWRVCQSNKALSHARTILLGSVPAWKKGEPALSGVDDMRTYLRKEMAKDVRRGKPELAGDWAENADHIAQSLKDALCNPEAGRLYTGFDQVDKYTVIGSAQQNRYIGILGWTNHRKTGVALCMMYNFARAGKRVLYVSCEDTVEITWQRLTFMHDEFVQSGLPGHSFWLRCPRAVTQEHRDALDMITENLKSGEAIPGSIDVIQVRTWAAIMERLQSSPEPYDALVIDYVGHLETEGKNRTEEVKAIFRAAQSLSRTYKEGRGLVVVTPLQANKAGMGKVDEQEAEEWGAYGDLGAVEMYTDAARDMDLVIGVWSKGYIQSNNQVKLSCVKSRNEFFPTHLLCVDPRTQYMRDSISQFQKVETVAASNVHMPNFIRRTPKPRLVVQ